MGRIIIDIFVPLVSVFDTGQRSHLTVCVVELLHQLKRADEGVKFVIDKREDYPLPLDIKRYI